MENGARQQSSEEMNPLTGYVENHPAGVRIDSGYRAPSFHGSGYDPVIHQFELNGFIRCRKGGFGFGPFPAFPMETLIVPGLIPYLRCLRAQTVFSLNGGVQQFIVDPQLVGSIQRLLFGLGNDEGHSIADMSHPIDRQGRARGLTQGVPSMLLTSAPQGITNAVCTKILSGVDGEYAGQSDHRIYRSRRCAREHAGSGRKHPPFHCPETHPRCSAAPRVKR